MGPHGGGEALQRRRRAGRKAVAQGKAFENFVEGRLESHVQIGILAWWQHNQPSTALRGGRLFRAAPAGTDYAGIFMGGLALTLETKEIGALDGKIRRFPRADIAPRQLAHLDATAHSGGLALLGVSFEDPEWPGIWKSYAAPWRLVRWQKLRSAETVGPEDLEPYRFEQGRPFLTRFVEVCRMCRVAWLKPEYATRALPIACGCPPGGR